MIHVGDCLSIMRGLPDKSVQTCITSPPYFGLRDYGMDGQHGLEATPAAYVAGMVEVFREVRRLLRDDGTMWLNLGDSYARNPKKGGSGPGGKNRGWYGDGYPDKSGRFSDGSGGNSKDAGLRSGEVAKSFSTWGKEKDLIGIPWRVAFALQEDGWYLRQDIIWHKPNPMPESVRDRCTKAHEYVFLMSKSPRYRFDADAIAEPVAQSSIARLMQPTLEKQAGSSRVPGKTNGNMKAVGSAEKRNKRSVWSVNTQPFKGAHFATFPPDLIVPCVLAGSRPGDVVFDPYLGAGTTAVVAERLGRRWDGCELNPEYAALAQARIDAALAQRLEDEAEVSAASAQIDMFSEVA